MTKNTAHFELGETVTSLPTGYLGTKVTFTDRDVTDESLLDSGATIVAQCVQNTSGGALTRGVRVRCEDGELGRKVDTVAGADETCYGLTDPYVGSGNIASNAYFWLILSGMVTCLSDGTPTLGEEITGAASGKIKLMPGTPTAATLTARCGVANQDGGSDGDYVKVFFRSPSGPLG